MALERGRFGIEYDPRQRPPESSGLGWLLALVACVALVSLTLTWVSHYRAERAAKALVETPPPVTAPPPAAGEPESPVVVPETKVVAPAVEKRPHQLQVLLMRREAAVKARDIEMEASTIEQIRLLPGSPAADLDDALARRLGQLNMARLFAKRNRQWVKEITVKRGDSASRIAIENGTTLAALEKLNRMTVSKVLVGQKLFVMNHPHFQLVVHRRSQTADLTLNERFFKRYDLTAPVKPAEGRYELSGLFRNFIKTTPLTFKPADRQELDMLLPIGTPVLVSEM